MHTGSGRGSSSGKASSCSETAQEDNDDRDESGDEGGDSGSGGSADDNSGAVGSSNRLLTKVLDVGTSRCSPLSHAAPVK